jgi:protein-tyrosine kinase
MSIIETALHKAQQHGSPVFNPAVTHNVATSHKYARRIDVDSARITEERTLRKCAVDPQAMESHHVLLQVSDQAALRAYKILRTRILQRLHANRWHSLAVTGTEVAEGKTLSAINLALALAQDVHTRVVLIDLDLQRPQLARYLGMSHTSGLGDYLLGEATSDDIIYDIGVERLAVIPNSRPIQHSSEYLSTPRMAELLRSLQSDVPQRVLIFDMPPLLLSDDVLTFAPQVDGLLLVVSEGHTSRTSIEKAREVLGEMNMLGVVLNRSIERNDSAYRYY